MMAELAKCDFINRVIFVNPLVSIRTFFRKNNNHNSSSRIINTLFPSKVASKILVYAPMNIVPHRKYLTKLKRIEHGITLKYIRHLNDQKPYILFMNCPNIMMQYLLDELLKSAELSIFDFSDDFVELGYGEQTTELFRRTTTKYAKAADIVLTVNDHIKKKYGFLNSNIHVIRNATNYYNFNRKAYKTIEFFEKVKQDKKPIIGYIGIANMSRIDADVLDFLLAKRPDWQFVFIGSIHLKFTERYLHYKNVQHIPPVDYESLPDYIRYFDVAVVPFKINENTKGNDLLKLHDYLAMGKPVVSTDVGGAKDLKDSIVIADRPVEFLEGIEQALVNDNYEHVLKRRNLALQNSWGNRVKELEELIRNELDL